MIAAKIGTFGFVMYVKYNSSPKNPLFTTLKPFLSGLEKAQKELRIKMLQKKETMLKKGIVL